MHSTFLWTMLKIEKNDESKKGELRLNRSDEKFNVTFMT